MLAQKATSNWPTAASAANKISRLKICADFENFLLPHHFECHWNDTYNWGRDGAQCFLGSMCDARDEYSKKYYRKMLRK